MIKTDLRTSHTKKFVVRLERKDISTQKPRKIPNICGADLIQITPHIDAGTADIFILEVAKVQGRGAKLGEGRRQEDNQ